MLRGKCWGREAGGGWSMGWYWGNVKRGWRWNCIDGWKWENWEVVEVVEELKEEAFCELKDIDDNVELEGEVVCEEVCEEVELGIKNERVCWGT